MPSILGSLTFPADEWRAVVIVLVGAAVLWSCNSSADNGFREQVSGSPAVVESPGAPVEQVDFDGPIEGRLLTLLEKIPAPGTSQYFLSLSDFKKFREIRNIETPSDEASEEELTDYLQALLGLSHDSPDPIGWLPALTGIDPRDESEAFILRPYLGFDFRDIDSTGVLSTSPLGDTRDFQIIQGPISSSRAETLLESCAECAPSEIRVHLDTEYRAWENPRWDRDIEVPPPILGRRLNNFYLLIEEGHVLLTRENDEIEAMIEALNQQRPSMADDAGLAALVDGLDAMEAAGIVITSPGISLDQLFRGVSSTESERLMEFTMRAPLLAPSSVIATGVGGDLEGPFTVIALLHEDAEAAEENATRLPDRIRQVLREDGAPWADQVQSMEVEVSGRILFARLRPPSGQLRPILHYGFRGRGRPINLLIQE